jgi:hypothetical protein
VLDDCAGRKLELTQDSTGGIEIGEVVEGELLARQLLDAGQQVAAGFGLLIVRGSLMRVLAEWQVAFLLE